jgi:hypothetical protein
MDALIFGSVVSRDDQECREAKQPAEYTAGRGKHAGSGQPRPGRCILTQVRSDHRRNACDPQESGAGAHQSIWPPGGTGPLKAALRIRAGMDAVVAGGFAGAWICTKRQPRPPAEPANAYVNPAVCAGCHPGIAATYRKTGMGRSFARANAENVPAFGKTSGGLQMALQAV